MCGKACLHQHKSWLGWQGDLGVAVHAVIPTLVGTGFGHKGWERMTGGWSRGREGDSGQGRAEQGRIRPRMGCDQQRQYTPYPNLYCNSPAGQPYIQPDK